MKIVFVGGIHGVGKSTLCERLASSEDVLHVKASSLVRGTTPSTHPPSEKAVQDVGANQAVLLARFEEVLATCTAKAILIDGHFALGRHDGTIEPIAVDVFAALRVSTLVCLQGSPGLVASR